jgi:hypothetical protein
VKHSGSLAEWIWPGSAQGLPVVHDAQVPNDATKQVKPSPTHVFCSRGFGAPSVEAVVDSESPPSLRGAGLHGDQVRHPARFLGWVASDRLVDGGTPNILVVQYFRAADSRRGGAVHPDGTVNPDKLRLDDSAVTVVAVTSSTASPSYFV